MEKQYKNDSTKNNGSIVIYFLFFKLLIFIFSLTVLNIKKTNEKIYRLNELYQCHKNITIYELSYLKKQQFLNNILKGLFYLKKIPKLNLTSKSLIEVTKTSQEILFLLRTFHSQSSPYCYSSFVSPFNSHGLLKRKVLFLRDKKTQEILYRKKSTQIIYSKNINFIIDTNYFKKDKKIVTKSALKKMPKTQPLLFLQRERAFHL